MEGRKEGGTKGRMNGGRYRKEGWKKGRKEERE